MGVVLVRDVHADHPCLLEQHGDQVVGGYTLVGILQTMDCLAQVGLSQGHRLWGVVPLLDGDARREGVDEPVVLVVNVRAPRPVIPLVGDEPIQGLGKLRAALVVRYAGNEAGVVGGGRDVSGADPIEDILTAVGENLFETVHEERLGHRSIVHAYHLIPSAAPTSSAGCQRAFCPDAGPRWPCTGQ